MAVLLVLVALVLGVASQVLPMAERHPDKIAAWLSQRAGRTVSFDRVQTAWTRRGPLLQLDNLRMGQGAQAFAVGDAEMLVSVYAGLLPGQPFSELRLRGLDLTLERAADGRWQVRGLPGQQQPGSDPLAALEGLGELQVIDGKLAVVAPVLGIDARIPRIDLRLRVNGDRVRAGMRAWPKVDATPLDAALDFHRRRGDGQACWTGLRAWPEELDWILFSSADGSDWLEAHELPRWQAAIDSGARIILGDRTALEASRRELKPVQRFGNYLSSVLIRLGWGVRHRDMSSLRLVRRSAYDTMDLADRGFGWNVETHVRAAELGLPVAEVPVLYRPRTGGVSKISGNLKGSCHAGAIILGTLWKLLWSRSHRLGLSRNPNHPKPINER